MINEASLLQTDAEARRRILEELDTTFLVEAGAGSGKTTSIVGRMIAVIKEGKAEARHIAAITFTNKAAAELMGRFRMRLEQESAKAATDDERALWDEALRQLPACFIGTIHAFCGRLLRERPIEAGLDPAFREIDETEDLELRERNWDRYLMLLEEQGATELLDELIALNMTVEDLRAVYHRVSQYEDVEFFTEPAEKPDFSWIRESLPPLLEEAAPYIPAYEPEKGWDPLQKAIRLALRFLDSKGTSDEMSLLQLVKLFDRGLSVTQNRWTDKRMAKQISDKFQAWRITMLEPFFTKWREYLHPKVVAFVQPAVRYNRESRLAEGKLNFQDLLMKAAELLRGDSEIRRYFTRRFEVLFVDEFQDTDPIQAEMMMLLTGADPAEADWRKAVPRPGSLFVVGDPKQSIYRFRRADISTYNFVKSRIAASGDVLGLNRNFRSVKAIGDYVNYAFESKFAAPDKGSDFQAPYVRMLTQLPNPAGKKSVHGVYTMQVPKQDFDRQLDIACCDAERMASYIAWACRGNLTITVEKDGNGQALTRPAVPGDFLIMVKHRKYIGLYAAMLERYGLPSETSGSETMTQELAAIRALAQALNNPLDQVALLAVLRGLLFGISDDELYHYRREGGRIYLYASREEEALSEKSGRVDEALRALRKYAEWTRSVPALSALSRILDDMGLIAAAAGGGTSGGAIRSGTLIKLLETLQQDADAAVDWAALTERLVKLTEDEALESASLFSGSGAAVRIMNLHKAKGLEAPVVFLACPCGNVDHDATEHIDRLAEPPKGYFTISKQRDSYTSEVIAQPVGWAERNETERLFMHAETERLLYVAATRAKQLLIVSQYPSRPAIDPWSLLAGSLQHQLELDEVSAKPVIAEELLIMPDIQGWSAERQSRLEKAAQPSYRSADVTGLAKSVGDGVPIRRSAGGKGMAYGTLVHRCLQALGEGMDASDLPLFCKMAAQEEEAEEKWIEPALDAVRKTAESELWERCMRSARRYFEFSIRSARVESETAVNADGAAGTILLRGVIDLVFEEVDGSWVIADFKTDHHDVSLEERLAAYYRPQVKAYAEEWERLTGGRVKEAGLYFLHTHRYVVV